MIVWHYTTGEKLAGIFADGEIIPATAGVEPELDAKTVAQLEEIIETGIGQAMEIHYKETPGVWFSRRQTWEPTATKGFIGPDGIRRTRTMKEMLERSGGLARIGVDSEGMASWLHHRKTSGISSDTARRLVRAAAEVGSNPGDWFVHYDSVPRAKWVAVQRWLEERWQDVAQP